MAPARGRHFGVEMDYGGCFQNRWPLWVPSLALRLLFRTYALFSSMLDVGLGLLDVGGLELQI